MKVCLRRFNIYFTLLAVAGLLAGCASTPKKSDKDKKKEEKPMGALRIHMETSPNGAGTTQTVNVLRSAPVSVTILKEPIFTEVSLLSLNVVETDGDGFALQMQFDESSALVLEQYSAVSQGRHFVIFAQWGDKLSEGRWIAAPLISRRIATGVFTFTADMTREEAQKLAIGVNNAITAFRKTTFK